MVEIDEAGHPLGGAFRFAAYAQYAVAICLNEQGIGGAITSFCTVILCPCRDFHINEDGVRKNDTMAPS